MQDVKMLWGNDRNAVIALFALNMGVYMLIKVAVILFATTPNIANGSSLSIVEQNLILTPNPAQLLHQPWSFFTHFFTHTTLINLLSNIVWLGLFSYLAQKVVGNGSLVPVYLYGGIVSGTITIICAALGTNITAYFGAQSGILALVGLLLAYKPNYKILPHINNGGIPVLIIAVVYITVYLLSQIITDNSFSVSFSFILAGIASLGVGYLFGKSLLKGKDYGAWMHSLYDDLLGKGMVPNQKKKENFYKTNGTPFEKKLSQNEENLNRILEKINLTGINSLTQEEKVFLQQTKNT